MPRVPSLPDLAAAALAAAFVLGYQLWLSRTVRRDPSRAVHARYRLARAAWVRAMMAERSSGVLAVQTLRNSLMASTMMASTVVLLIVGAIGALADPARLAALAPHAPQLKLAAIVADLFVSFFFFAMAVRSFNHVGYMITVAPGQELPEFPVEQITAHLHHAAFNHFLGLRTFLFCIPLVFWLFGPLFVLAGGLGLVVALYRLDRPPSS